MSIVKAHDVAFVRFGAPDLTVMARFLQDFGMTVARQDADRLYMRGYGGAPFCHVTERRDAPAFLALGLWIRSLDDLQRLADHDGAAVEPLDGPNGGHVVRLTDPDGFIVEAMVPAEAAARLDEPHHQLWNHGGSYPRQSAPRRVGKRPSNVRRLGHVVLGVTDFRISEAWYKDRFGFLTSDEIQPAPGVGIGAFMRADRGDQPCDHHTLFLMQRPGHTGFMHAAFEVADLDDLMAGHDFLKAREYDHAWGIGRHLLGSQVFDYWRDPYGHEVEHWTDGDQFVAQDPGGVASIEDLIGVQWGAVMPLAPEDLE